MKDSRYPATTAFLFNQFPMYQMIGAGAYKPGLCGMERLDAFTGHPHASYPCIHVAGTNGKGSTCHMLAAVFQKAGYRTGLYTSPHLADFRERIKVNAEMISESFVCDFTESLPGFEDGWRPSFFEITTAMAFAYFARQQVDIAIIETGLGGRLDATNIITPVLSVITSIGLEHCEHLGDTLALIAGEKAGIMKAGVPAIIGEYHPETWPVFAARANACGSELWLADTQERRNALPDWLSDMDLGGLCQEKNVATVWLALQVLMAEKRFPKLRHDGFGDALCHTAAITGLHGRWERLSEQPLIIADTAHNAHGLAYLLPQLAKEKYRKLYMVFGVVKEKDLESILPLLPRDGYYFFTQAAVDRALPADELAIRCMAKGFCGEVAGNTAQAMQRAKELAGMQDLIFVGGSNFVVGEVLQVLGRL